MKSNELDVNKYFTAASYMVGDYKRDEYVLATDIGVPLSKLENALELSDKMTGTYPLWICPSKDNYHPDKIFCTRRKELCEENMILDLGIYGIKNSNIPSKKVNQTFEKFSFSHGVFKGFFLLATLSMMNFGIILIKKNMKISERNIMLTRNLWMFTIK